MQFTLRVYAWARAWRAGINRSWCDSILLGLVGFDRVFCSTGYVGSSLSVSLSVAAVRDTFDFEVGPELEKSFSFSSMSAGVAGDIRHICTRRIRI